MGARSDSLRRRQGEMPREPLAQIVTLLLAAGREGRTVLIVGNGPSAAVH